MYRVWTRAWDDAVDPPTWHVGDSVAYRLANHWDLAARQVRRPKQRKETGGGIAK